MPEKILVTGASGFLGAWVVRDLDARGIPYVLFDRDPELRRLDDLLPERPRDIALETGDIADLDTVLDVVRKHEPTAVIHLAALQMPFCRPNPMLGARVNVLGTLTVFEAARQLGSIEKVVYASSAAVIGPDELYDGKRVGNDAKLAPATHYGVFKQANEGAARVYFQDHGVSSIGLRPWTVYGLGRDQGLTSDATRAIKAALLERELTIRYSGRNALQFAGDVAAAFVECALDRRQVQRVFNLRGLVVEMQEFIAELDRRLPGAGRRIRRRAGPFQWQATWTTPSCERSCRTGARRRWPTALTGPSRIFGVCGRRR